MDTIEGVCERVSVEALNAWEKACHVARTAANSDFTRRTVHCCKEGAAIGAGVGVAAVVMDLIISIVV
jgi:hypothetical protein